MKRASRLMLHLRRKLGRLLFLILTVFGLPGAGRAAPNILLILADDLGYGDVACNNPQSLLPTPHLDALAAGGRRFTNAHAPASVCSPTRYGVLTGRYAWRTAMKEGVLYDFCPALIRRGRTTVASLLKAAGYRTALVGKWHVGLDWTPKPGDPGDWQWGQSIRYDRVNMEARVDFIAPVRNGPLDLGFDTAFFMPQCLSRWFIEGDRVSAETPRKDTVDDVFVAKATAFLRDHAAPRKGTPFFLYLALSAPHSPLTPPENLQGTSKTGALGDMCLWVDQSVGRMTSALRELGLEDDTLVLFSSDNGAVEYAANNQLGHHPSGDRRGYKTDIWDGGTHVPFIARWPGRIPAGTQSPALVGLVDLLATFAALTSQPIPPWNGEDSFDLLPALTGDDTMGRGELITHSYTGAFAIRDREWKLILGTRGSGGHQGITGQWQPMAAGFDRPDSTDIGQLYHIADDPGETTGVWRQNPDVVQRMRARLDLVQRQGFSVPCGIR